MRLLNIATALALLAVSPTALAETAPAASGVGFTLKDHRFSPDAVILPAGRSVDVTLINQDNTIEEFDSDDLGVEETAHPGETIHFKIGPLKPGAYDFMGEFHPVTAHGTVTATAG